MISHLDTSAVMKLLVEKPEWEALLSELQKEGPRVPVSSWLPHNELHCAVGRHPEVFDLAAVTSVLSTVSLVDLRRGDLMAAALLAPQRSAHAIHLAVAL